MNIVKKTLTQIIQHVYKFNKILNYYNLNLKI